MKLTKLALILSLALVGCVPPSSIQDGQDKDMVKGAPLVEHTNPRTVLPELADKPFTYSFESDVSTQSLGRESKYYLKNKPETVVTFYPDETRVTFEEGATDGEVSNFLQTYGARIVKQEKKLKAMPDSSYIEDGYTDTYLVAFEDSKVALDQLPQLSEEVGVRGEMVFSDKRAAKALQQVLKVHKNKKANKVFHIGINQAGTDATGVLYNEGNGSVTPSTSQFWYMRDYGTGGIYGNRINPQSSTAAWSFANGAGVKVAVIDNRFMAPGEPYATQLWGNSGSVWSYNFENNNQDIRVGMGHGRPVASLIFSALNDSAGAAGVAPHAIPYAYHVYADQDGKNMDMNQIARALDQARYDGVKIVNMSFSTTETSWLYPAWMWGWYGAIKANYDAGMIQVSSTGNKGNQNNYPAGYGEVLGVSSHDTDRSVSSYSSGTANMTFADIYAGGSNVAVANQTTGYDVGMHGGWGTSFAAPIVTGALALYVQQGKLTNNDSAITKLRNNAWYYDNRAILDVYWGLIY